MLTSSTTASPQNEGASLANIKIFSEKEQARKKEISTIKDGVIGHPSVQSMLEKVNRGEKLTEKEVRLLKALKKAADKKISELH